MSAGPAIAVIPARMGSVRFPGKVLACETGRPLIAHVCEAASRAPSIGRVVVATDDERVRNAVVRAGFECVMTSPEHPNGTSRLAEAADTLGIPDSAVIVNVQGDEPEIEPAIIDAAVAELERSGAPVATVAAPITRAEDAVNPNIVKVVRRLDGTALCFSRSLIPFDRDGAGTVTPLRHIGLYAYRREFLRRYIVLHPTPLEEAEKLEQLRVLEHGYAIGVSVVEGLADVPAGIDTPEQYAIFVARWRRQASGG